MAMGAAKTTRAAYTGITNLDETPVVNQSGTTHSNKNYKNYKNYKNRASCVHIGAQNEARDFVQC